MNQCSVEECEREARVKGMCQNHYGIQKYAEAHPDKRFHKTTPKPSKPCSHEGCDKPVLVKGLCKKHYRWLKHPPQDRTCKADGCTNKRVAKGYCRWHYYRFIHNIPFDFPGKGNGGVRHWNWKGGISYPFQFGHKARGERMTIANEKCEECGDKAYVVHHKDRNKRNNDIDNLIALCHSCHRTKHPRMARLNEESLTKEAI